MVCRKRRENCRKKCPKCLEVSKICRYFAFAFALEMVCRVHRKVAQEEQTERLVEGSENFFEKSFPKIWRIKNLALPLHHFRADKIAESKN